MPMKCKTLTAVTAMPNSDSMKIFKAYPIRCLFFFNIYLVLSISGAASYVNTPMVVTLGSAIAFAWGLIFLPLNKKYLPTYRDRLHWKALAFTFLFIVLVSGSSVFAFCFFEYEQHPMLCASRLTGNMFVHFIIGFPLVIVTRANRLILAA